jgi:hypothetical protein
MVKLLLLSPWRQSKASIKVSLAFILSSFKWPGHVALWLVQGWWFTRGMATSHVAL